MTTYVTFELPHFFGQLKGHLCGQENGAGTAWEQGYVYARVAAIGSRAPRIQFCCSNATVFGGYFTFADIASADSIMV